MTQLDSYSVSPAIIAEKRFKILFFALIFIFASYSFKSISQNAIIGAGFTNGWGSGCGSNYQYVYFGTSAGTSYILTANAKGTGNQYWRMGIDWGGTISQMNNTGADQLVSKNTTYTLNSSCTTSGAMYYNVGSTSYNYIFKTKDAGSSPSRIWTFFEVQGTVRSVSSISQSPAASVVDVNQAVTVTANLDGAFSTGQGVYLRYTTTTDFSTSTVVQMTGSGTTYTADIPSGTNTISAAIKYYVFTSGNTGPASNGSDADLYTINLNNNSGSNYSYTVSNYVTKADGDWNTGSTWMTGAVPPATANVIINHAVGVSSAVSNAMNSITINSSKSLTINNASAALTTTSITNNGTISWTAAGTLTIATSGTLTNNSTFTYGTGNVAFAGTATVTGTVGFNNVTLAGGVNFGSASTINGTMTINSGGYANTNAPAYASASTLKYNTTGTYGRGTEWSATSGAGYPYYVQISNNTTLDMGANSGTATARQMAGSLTIDAGSTFSMANTAMTAAVTILGNINNGTGTLTLSGSAGGDLNIKGNWSFNGTFNPNSRAVTFNGSSGQQINNAVNFAYLTLNNTNGLTLAAAATVANTLTLTSGKITLGTNNLTVNNGGSISGASSSNYVVTDNTAYLIMYVSSSEITFPVGTAAIYAPAYLTQAGTAENLFVRVQNSIDNAPSGNSNSLVNLQWTLNEQTAGSNNITTKFQWNVGQEGSSFNRAGTVQIGRYISGSYTTSAATEAGIGPYTASATGMNSTISGIPFVVGNNTAFSAATPSISTFTSSGYTGSTITIAGSNFTGATAVSFGGNAAASFVVDNDAQITAYVGQGGTSGNVSVTTPSGSDSKAGFTYSGYISNAATDWNTASTWLGSSVPPAAATVTINHSVSINSAVINAAAALTVNGTKSLTFGASGTLTSTTVTNNGSIIMTSGGTLTIATAGTLANGANTFTGGAGTVAFTGTGTVSGTIAFNNFNIAGGVNFGTGSTLNGTLQINAGGWINTNCPLYGAASTLKYNTGGTYGRNLEWSANNPVNVQISNNTTLDLGANSGTGTARTMTGSLTIDAGSTFSMAITPMTAALTINGNINNGTGTLTLSGSAGGDLNIKGNWNYNGTFNHNSRAVAFIGTSSQQINNATTFAYLTINNSAGVILNSVNITIANQINLTSGTFTVGSSNTVNMNSGTTVSRTSGSLASGNSAGTYDFAGTGIVSGTVGFYNITISGGVNFGAASTINGTLTINAGGWVDTNTPTYATNSTLKYNSGTNPYGRNLEWNATSGAGYPYNVQISNNTTLDIGANSGTGTARQVAGSLTVDAGSSLSMNVNAMTQALTITGNVAGAGTITLSSSIGGDLKLKGNWTFTGTLNNNSRAVFFNGTATQDIQSSKTFDYLYFSNNSGVNISAATTANQLLELQSGILGINANNAITGTTLIKLSGGTFKTNGNSDNTGAALLLNDNTTLDLSTGVHTINFAASNAQTWTTGKTLTITNWTGTGGSSGTNGKIFFGSNNSGLTSTQLQMISFTGYSSTPILLSNGELVPGCSLASEPTITTSGVTFSPVGGLRMTLNWVSNGNGSRRIVVAKAGSIITGTPIDGTTYTANTVFGTGSTIAANEFVVYDGDNSTLTFTLTALSFNTRYYFKFFEYNGTACTANYLTTTITSANQITFNGYPCITGGGLWSSSATWVDGIPPSGADVIIRDNLTLDQNATVHNLNIWSTKTLTIQNYNLSLNTGGILTNDGTFNATNGKVIFNGSGSVAGTVTFNNVDISGAVDFGATSALNGTLQINTGGSVNTNAPIYADNSTLKYACDYELASEWYSNQSSGQGVPYNVIIDGGNVFMNTGSGLSRTLRGSLTINTGQTFSLSTTAGGDLIIKGDFINNGSFYANGRSLGFYGTTAQTINTGSSSTTSINYLDLNNSGGLSLQTLKSNNLDINNQLKLSSGTLTVGSSNSITMVIGSEINGAGGNFASGNAGGTIICSGKCDIKGSLTFNYMKINNILAAPSGARFWNNATIAGTLELNSYGFVDIDAPTYATSAILKYNAPGAYDRRVEWCSSSGPGYPYHVWLTNNTEVRLGHEFPGIARQCSGNLTIDGGSQLRMDYPFDANQDMTQPLTVTGNINNAGLIQFSTKAGNHLYALGNLVNSGTLTLSTSAGSDLFIKGNFTNNGTFNHNSRATTFNGTTAQTISGSSSISFGYIVLNNTSTTGITLANAVGIDNQITFTSGLLNTDDTNILTMNAGSSVVGAKTTTQEAGGNSGAIDISFVNGPMIKAGNSNFIFPVGDKNGSNKLHPLSIEFSGTPGTNSYYAKYLNSPPANLTNLDAGIKLISGNEYWSLHRVSGSDGVYLTLRWRNMQCPTPQDLFVAHYSATESKWKSEGNGGTTGINWTNSYGTVKSANLINTFSDFTIGSSSDQGWVPLPIELMSFTATPENKEVQLKWTTATEINNDYFTLEKSSDAVNFITFATIKGAGNSNKLLKYNYYDENPYNGINYYRLKQTDFDGAYKYSDIISAAYHDDNIDISYNKIFVITPEKKLLISFYSLDNSTAPIELFDINGKIILFKSINTASGNNSTLLDISSLTTGIYLVRVKNGNNYITKKIII